MTYTSAEAVLTDISQKLDVVIGLLVVQSMDKDDMDAMFERLRDVMKLSPKVAARVVGISENAANLRYSRLKRKKSQAKPKA